MDNENKAIVVSDIPWYRRWWFLSLLLIILAFCFSNGSTDWQGKNSTNKNEIKPIILKSGKYVVGKTLRPERYVITAKKGNGEIEANKDRFDIYLGKKFNKERNRYFISIYRCYRFL